MQAIVQFTVLNKAIVRYNMWYTKLKGTVAPDYNDLNLRSIDGN
jgi:hypothetical protein